MKMFAMLLTDNMYSGNMEGWEGGTGEWFQAVVSQQYADDILLQMGYTLGINRLDCKYLLHMFLLCY